MNPSRLFILRPVATSLAMLAIVLAGLVGFHFMPVAALPQVDYPTIQVQTLYPGASPEVMSTAVTAPLERQLGQMPGLVRMSSTSAAGASIVTLQFALSLTLDIAEQEVQAAINAAANLLPADLPAPPVYAKVNPADAPVLTLAVTSTTLPLTEVQNLVQSRLAQKISQVDGVGLVTLSGGQRPAVRIQVDTDRLAALGIGLDQLRATLASANANGAKGSFDGPTRSYAINANDQLLTVDDYANMTVAFRDNAPVHLADIARIAMEAENVKLGAWMNTEPAIILNVQRQPGANVIATVDAIKARLPQLLEDLPAGVKAQVLTDRTNGIRASVHDVGVDLVLAVVLVVLVIFLFLRNLRATVIASLAVPVSLIGALGVMYLLGYSINNLSLMALTIATGFVVDDAIVMIENIARYLEKGDSPLQAALKGAKQIGFTIISLTVSLVAVLIPLLFMTDVIGRLFREFAVTLAITIVISAVVSLTLTASLSALGLKAHAATSADESGSASGSASGSRLAAFSRHWQSAFDRLVDRYAVALRWVLVRQRLTLWVAAGTLVLTALLYVVIDKGLFPTQDTGELQVEVHAPGSVSYARMAQLQQSVAQILLKDRDVASLSSFIGVDGANNTALHTGRMLVTLKPHDDRDRASVIVERLQQACAGLAGITVYLRPVQDLTIDAETGPTQYQLSLEGADQQTVLHWTQQLVNHLQTVAAVRNVSSGALQQGQAAMVNINRDLAARMGVSVASVNEALYSAFGQRIVSTIFTDSTQYRVILEALPGKITQPQHLANVYLPTVSGKPTPLDTLAAIETRSAPLQITRVGQFPAASINFDTTPGISLGQAVAAIRAAESAIGMPASVSTTFLGAASAYQSSQSNQLWLILAAVICVYIVLGVLYESFTHPLTILSTLPSASVGALLALMITGNDLGVIGIIGIILLIGIVKKNAIMMIDFAIEAQRHGFSGNVDNAEHTGTHRGMSPMQAIEQAALLRFRPIMMTTLAALGAALPLMFGFGEGSELRRPLGITLFGGLMLSQLLTLFTTPVIYLAFERLSSRRAAARQSQLLTDVSGDSDTSPPAGAA